MSNFINKVLKISQQYSYLKPVIGKDDVLSYYKYGPLGELLCHHLTNEWTLSSVITRDIPVFPFHSLPNSDNLIEAIKDEYLEAKNICQNTLPFCITFSRIPKTRPFNKNSSNASENKYFRPLNTIELKSITFTTPNDDRQFFYFWQRQRKIWWRKFAAKPGRFSLSEIKTSENMECTEIQAKFEWGSESVETIRWLKGDIFQNISNEDKKLCEILVKRKWIFPSVIESTSHLDTMAFCYLCDAFTEEIRLDTELPRQFIKLHRKLTPYRTAFAVELKEKSHQEDLKLLAEYFALNLKKAGFPVLYVPQLCYKSPNEVFEYYDLLGIPYVIVLKSSTLTDGIFGLRSRETTIQELLHMNQLVEYFEMLFKNY